MPASGTNVRIFPNCRIFVNIRRPARCLYLCVPGKVFANAQTGNIVLLSQNICERNWLQSAHYFVPLAAFAIGIIVAEQIRGKYQNVQNIHWRQIVLLLEMILLFLVSFLPQSLDMLANALVSFSCAMQVQTFRKVNGYAFASTMCIGNMRSGMEALLHTSEHMIEMF